MSPRRGHFRYQGPAESGNRRGRQSSSFLRGFLLTSLTFCAAHGIFLGVILLLLNRNGHGAVAEIHWRSALIGCLIVLGFLIADFAVDVVRVRNWSFFFIEQTANRGLGRVVVIHLTLIFGLLAVALTDAPSALFGVFVVLRTIYALSVLLPQWEPAKPPRWLNKVMNRVPNVHPGKTFEEHWSKDRAEEAKRRERNETPWARARR